MKGVHWYALAWLILIGGLGAIIKMRQPGLFVGALILSPTMLTLALQHGPLLEQFQYEFTAKPKPPLWRCPLFFVTAAGVLATLTLLLPFIQRLL